MSTGTAATTSASTAVQPSGITTCTGGAAAPFPPGHVVIPLGWTAMLALVVAAVPVLTAAVAAAHRPDPAAQLRLGDSA